MRIFSSHLLSGLMLAATLAATAAEPVPLKAQGDNFVDPAGKPVKLWGINLVAFYPDRPTAAATAKNLASLGINCARPHHMLRPSGDWNPGMASGALMDYRSDSMTPDPEAWDRFFFLTNELRKNGIYLLLSVGDTRHYRPDDVKVLDGGEADNLAWRKSVEEMNQRHWKEAIDARKMMPLFDERAARVVENYARRLLTAVNPYSGRKFADDPQLLTVELLNEFALDYVVICNNRLPEYQHRELTVQWEAYLKKHGAAPCDFYTVKAPEQVRLRADFMRETQTRYFRRLEKVIRECGYRGSILFSNLWEGEPAARLNAELNGSIEDHCYADPRVYLDPKDFVHQKTLTKVAGKPYILGEFNHSEGGRDLDDQKRKRAMLPLAAAANAAFQEWSGIVWFAWCHGGGAVGTDGWARREGRVSSLGNLVEDGMTLDHLRTAGLLFKNGMVRPSASPVRRHLDDIPPVRDYHGLMRGRTGYKPGWQSIHAIHKVFGKPTPAADAAAMNRISTENPPEPLVSDTGEIIRDLKRRQLLVKTPFANGFGGESGESGSVALPVLGYRGLPGFVTFLLVSADGRSLTQSESLLLSRTTLDAQGKEADDGVFTLTGLSGDFWTGRITRPREAAGKTVTLRRSNGIWELPAAGWHEIELAATD